MLFIGGVSRPLGLGLLLLGLIAPICGIGFRRGRLSNGFLGEPSKIPTLQRSLESEDLWFEQKLDHFKGSDTRTWQQRYFVNADYYRNDSSAPIFLMATPVCVQKTKCGCTPCRRWQKHPSSSL